MDEASPARGRAAESNRRRSVVAGGVAALLIVLAVAASRPPTIAVGGGAANEGPLVALFHAAEVVGLALEAAILVLLVVLLWPQRRPKDAEEEPKPEARPVPWWLRLILFLMPLAAFGALLWTVLHLRPGATPAGEPPLASLAPMSPGDAPLSGGALGLAGWEVLFALLLAAVVVAAVLRQLFWQPRRGFVDDAPRPGPETAALAAAVAASLGDARQETDPRRAVIAAYATMERVLAERDLPRRESEATLEYMERLFGALPTGREAVATLTRLFEVARFSQHEVPPAAKRQAIDALVRLRDALGGAS